eukprot:1790078-Rhodomonas_salina.3
MVCGNRGDFISRAAPGRQRSRAAEHQSIRAIEQKSTTAAQQHNSRAAQGDTERPSMRAGRREQLTVCPTGSFPAWRKPGPTQHTLKTMSELTLSSEPTPDRAGLACGSVARNKHLELTLQHKVDRRAVPRPHPPVSSKVVRMG